MTFCESIGRHGHSGHAGHRWRGRVGMGRSRVLILPASEEQARLLVLQHHRGVGVLWTREMKVI